MSEQMKLKIETTEGNTYEVTAVVADLAKFDVLRYRLGFPPRDQGEFVFMCLVAYSALVRTGQISNNTKPEDFINLLASVVPGEAEEADADFPVESDNQEPHSA